MKKNIALVIIDVQQGIFTIPGYKVYNENNLLANIEQMIIKARENKIPIIYVQHEDADSLKKDTFGWSIHPQITPLKTDTVIHKKYSDAFLQTPLNEELKVKNIKRLIMAGLQTEFCIDTTCRSAFSLGYEVVLVKDAHSTIDGAILKAPVIIEHHNQIFDGRFASVKSTKKCLNIMDDG